MNYTAKSNRYGEMPYNRVGKSGLKLPAISLGLWHNFGRDDDFSKSKSIIFEAFDKGITHFDLANNYGPPPGSAEITFGRVLKEHMSAYRDEMIISTKAGYYMWPGPYGEWGSKKYMMASLDQSLMRMQLDYVDIFYSHRPDPDTPLEETMHALNMAIKSGKALYAGISSYSPNETALAKSIAREMDFPLIIHQPRYSMFDRWIENGLIERLEDEEMGAIVFSPLAQGLLTNKYLKSIPKNSRAAKESGFLQKSEITDQVRQKIKALNEIAKKRGQTLAQMAIAWVLRVEAVCSALIGVSSVKQLNDNISSLKNLDFTLEEYAEIDQILSQ